MLLIKNAKIYTMAGPAIEKGSILIDKGLIKAVGTGLAVPEGTQIIDASGKNIYPGFIDAQSQLGLIELALGFEGNDAIEASAPAQPQLRAYDGANPMDGKFAIARRGGITTAIISPSSEASNRGGTGTVIAGSMTAIKTSGDCIDDMIREEYVGMRATVGPAAKNFALLNQKFPSSRTSVAAVIRETLLKAMQYRVKKAAGMVVPYDLGMEAMLPIINKERPLVVHANLKQDIFNALRVLEEYDIRMVLLHVAEGHLIADDLAEAGVACLVGPLHISHASSETHYQSKTVAAKLYEAGVPFALIGHSGSTKSDMITIQAALAVAAGLPEEEALKAITLYPAQIYGIDDRVGSLEVGKVADLVLTQGCPLTRQGIIEYVYIAGEKVYEK